jgi:hypothetical protein
MQNKSAGQANRFSLSGALKASAFASARKAKS